MLPRVLRLENETAGWRQDDLSNQVGMWLNIGHHKGLKSAGETSEGAE